MIKADVINDDRARGFTTTPPPEARYAGFMDDKLESQGMAIGTIPIGSRVLDVGCGTGQFAKALQDQLNCDVLGIEPHPGRAELARSNGLRVLSGFLSSEMMVSEPPFEVVTLIDVLEHVPDPVGLLSLAGGFLVPRGKVIISVPNVAHWTVRLELLLGRFNYTPTGIMDATHLRWFTMKTIRDVVSAAHLRITEQRVSRGFWLREYGIHLPWRVLGSRSKRWSIDFLCRWNPGLFGCQHFIVATKD